MKKPLDIFVDGKSIRIGAHIGKGGEGEVFALDDGTGRALKVYTVHDLSQREEKIRAMLSLGIAEKSSLVAFPQAIATSRDGRFVGFLMRMVSGHKPLFELYSPAARKQAFPRADYRFLVRAALNTARAVGSVHRANCIIGDINESGILVSDAAIAALIDADSFQVSANNRQFLCRVGKPDYTPPELQDASLASVVRTQNHDAFGLAVLIFKLLFMGRHPFSGAYIDGQIELEKAIREFRFAYTRKRNVGMTPPPGAALLEDFPAPLAEAFETAFSREHCHNRPSAENWVSLLDELERSLIKCQANSLHHHSSVATHCPWCRLENKLGMLLFLPSHMSNSVDSIPDLAASSFNLNEVWATIQAVDLALLNDLRPILPNIGCIPSDPARNAKGEMQRAKVIGYICIFAAIALLFASPSAMFLWILLGIFGFAKSRAKTQTAQELLNKYVDIHSRWISASNDWNTRIKTDQVETLKNSLSRAKTRYAALAEEERQRIEKYEKQRREMQLERYLDCYQIRKTRIKGIGPSRLSTLASFGIETAADITNEKILFVPGFGEKNSVPLFEWRRKLESRFVYNEKRTSIDQLEIQKIQSEIRAEAAALRRMLLNGAKDLKSAVLTVIERSHVIDPILARLYGEKCKLETDLAFLNIPIPAAPIHSSPVIRPSASVNPASHQTNAPSTASSVPSCPRCGSRMRRRIARKGSRAGLPFYGCSNYPSCTGTRNI